MQEWDDSYCTLEDVNEAIAVIAECRIPEGLAGCPYPAYSPGGLYGRRWWSLDYALTMEAVKWLDDAQALEFICNLEGMQKDDGRIPLYSDDNYRPFQFIKEPVGSLPKFFQVAFDIAEMGSEANVKRKVLGIFQRNLEWWFKNRQDRATGLITAVFEETFIPYTQGWAGLYAPMDTNVQVLLGCWNAACLAHEIGAMDTANTLAKKANELEDAISMHLWDEAEGCYMPYLVQEKRRHNCKMASMFLGFYLPDMGRHKRLLEHLLDPNDFNWGTMPLTTVSKKDQIFQTVEGNYNGNPSWSGSVWALSNDAAIKALKHAGLDKYARELAVATVKAFRGNYAEFLHPFTGEGHGVKRYAWTAAIFLRILIEELHLLEPNYKGGNKHPM